MDDAEIIRQVLAGQHHRYADLVQRYQEPLIHFLRRILNSDEDILDCAQEAFVAVYRNLNRYSQDQPFRAWLYAIARNKAIDIVRKRQREITVVLDETLEDLRPRPEEIWFEKEQASYLAKILNELPAHYAQALFLRYHQDMSYTEIATVLQVPVSRVKTYLHRGKEKLRQELERRDIHERDGRRYLGSTISG
ncbi:RNA polymerase sigma factor [Desulfosporosinus sp. PR]|uniref:RNA polymerase sigma factor n=1 Tax=Candidatus Desulfosporosinus nitrosoreducens TaxID=3401928 RepID=UPI0027EA3994|nr:RNA polymerase sigma factor [Desulfosporosinus sp. PR]MDQ7094146.1 RNA polymerase sigma factor [Desulfosporosinus sp. PR]